MIYKVWIQIEEIDHDKDHYENVSEPIDIGKFDTLAEAEELKSRIVKNEGEIEVTVAGGVAYCDDPRVEIIDYDNH